MVGYKQYKQTLHDCPLRPQRLATNSTHKLYTTVPFTLRGWLQTVQTNSTRLSPSPSGKWLATNSTTKLYTTVAFTLREMVGYKQYKQTLHDCRLRPQGNGWLQTVQTNSTRLSPSPSGKWLVTNSANKLYTTVAFTLREMVGYKQYKQTLHDCRLHPQGNGWLQTVQTNSTRLSPSPSGKWLVTNSANKLYTTVAFTLREMVGYKQYKQTLHDCRLHPQGNGWLQTVQTNSTRLSPSPSGKWLVTNSANKLYTTVAFTLREMVGYKQCKQTLHDCRLHPQGNGWLQTVQTNSTRLSPSPSGKWLVTNSANKLYTTVPLALKGWLQTVHNGFYTHKRSSKGFGMTMLG